MMASLDHKDEEGSRHNDLKVHREDPEDDDHDISRQKQPSCSSSLSNSSVESVALENNDNGIADNTFQSKHADNEPPAFSYSSDFAYPSPVWSFQSASTPQFPPSQMMARPGYDPNRIPLSIFSGRPTNPLAWSHTSNESLFSIQAGNSSFAREQFFIGNKCVESPRFDESISKSTALHPVGDVVPSNCADNDIEGHSDSLSTRVACEETRDSPFVMHCESVKTLAESAAIVLHETPEAEDNSKEARVPREEAKDVTSVSCRSQESRISNRSFQFPLFSSIQSGKKSKTTIKSEKQEEDKPFEAPSAKAEKAPNPPRPRNRWYFPSCCRSLCR
ncbi:uncharacterized protein LOC114752036 [Neltuma alba]|uniref:uncharacterized protein LOC114752036 n=1 Tax=Neltuma alba TaxID=207710 RepID=UPI0010A3B829|nr:uncharacterized protein LOC114752036 [Prosopis alba]